MHRPQSVRVSASQPHPASSLFTPDGDLASMLRPAAEPLTFPRYPLHDVLILGAGFSRSLSEHMPLTDELGNLLLAYLHERFNEGVPGSFDAGFFEVWLSRMAEDQPYLWPDENYKQRATFSRCTSYIADVIEERTVLSLEDALAKEWLFPLLGTLHARRAVVLTFNQDTLIERAVEAACLPSWEPDEWSSPVGQQPTITWQDVTEDLPGPPPRGGWYGVTPKRAFRLYKLHGSTNWFWRSGDRSGATLAAWWPPGMEPKNSALANETAAKARLLPGRTAFVVPPAATKSAFYDNPVTEELWRRARISLEQSKQVSLVGYSFPPTDIVTSNLLRLSLVEALPARSTKVTVVNPRPSPVRRRLKEMGVGNGRVRHLYSVADYARRYVEEASRDLTLAMKMHLADSPGADQMLLVGFSLHDARPVVSIRPDNRDNVVELVLEMVPPGQPATSTHLRPDVKRLGLPELAKVLQAIPGRQWRLRTRDAGGASSDVVAALGYQTGHVGSLTFWQVLRTATTVSTAPTTPRVDISPIAVSPR